MLHGGKKKNTIVWQIGHTARQVALPNHKHYFNAFSPPTFLLLMIRTGNESTGKENEHGRAPDMAMH